MNFKIQGNIVSSVIINLPKGQSVFTQSGAMFWQSEGIEMTTNAKGGLFKGIGRVFAGESLFMVTYKAVKDSKIAFSSTVPGSIYTVDMDEIKNLIIQKGAFLVAESSVELKTVFNKKLVTGFFGGEGFILQKLRGSGTAFLEICGDIVEMNLKPNEVIKVDTGSLVAFEDGVKYEVETVKGVGNILFGGEGLFLTKLTGPGKVILQTMNIKDFSIKVSSYIPIESK